MSYSENTFKQFKQSFKKMSVQELIDTFNNDLGKPGWVGAREAFYLALYDEFQNRGIDISEVRVRGKNVKNRMKLVGKKVIID